MRALASAAAVASLGLALSNGVALAESQPLDIGLVEVVVVERQVPTINYRRPGGVGMHLDLVPTALAPDASGELDVDSKKGYVQVQADVRDLPAAASFGDEYMTYVLWAITPEGRATNLGEILVDRGGTRNRLEATTELQAFGLVVTAEPHFGVTMPSDVVVLENAIPAGAPGDIEIVEASYQLLQRGAYAFPGGSRTDLRAPSSPYYIVQARNARRIARDAGAPTWAPDAWSNAEARLAEAEAGRGRQRMAAARLAAQAFEDARLVSVERSRAERERQAQLEADRARLEAEMARDDAAVASHEAAAAEARADQAEVRAEAAEDAARRAEAEKAALRARLREQFQVIFETRETARGLILTMSNVHFDFNQATLTPGARERLARLAGVVLSHPGLELAVEGHADAIGSEEYNQDLSERRARSVRAYLVGQGMAASTITARGFGETRPVATNDTAEGRQLNRRVEIIVTGDVIGGVGG